MLVKTSSEGNWKKAGDPMAEVKVQKTSTGAILAVLASIAMIVMFTEIMLVPALPQVASDFPNDTHWIPWVLSMYLLVGAVATPLVGRLGDVYGKKKILIAVMGIYIIGLLGSGFSLEISNALVGTHNIFVLLFFRGVQGVGMGMFVLGFGIVRDTFPRERIPVAIGIISAMFSVGVSIGLLGGGYITSVAHWTDAFHVVTPFFLALAIASYFLIKDPVVTRHGGLDLPGSIALGVSIFTFLLALTQGQEWGWTSVGIIGLLIVSIVALIAFVFIELKAKDPVVRPSLFKNRGMLCGSAAAFFVGLCMFLVFQTLPFFLETPTQAGGHFGLTDTFTVGLYMFPSAVAQLIFGPMGGVLSRKKGPVVVLIAGMAVLSLGFFTLISLNSTVLELTISLLIVGAGMALTMVSMINVVVQSCEQSEFGVASGMNTLFRIVGGAIGPVLAAVILADYTMTFPIGPGQTITLFTEQGYIQTWWVGLGFALIGLVAAVVLRPRAKDICDIRPEEVPPGE
jgi:MFS family permease